MRKCTLCLIAFLFLIHNGFSQDFSALKDYSFSSKEDFKKAEPKVLESSKYVTGHPLNDTDVNWRYAIQFVIRWMSGTPDHSFSLDESVVKLSKDNPDLLGLYMACMAQYAIQNTKSAKDIIQLKLNAMTTLVTYCEEPTNNVKLNKDLKKLIEAKNKGQLEEYLKM